jgi:hypothetical protein
MALPWKRIGLGILVLVVGLVALAITSPSAGASCSSALARDP